MFGLRHRHVLKSPSLPVRLFGSQCRMIPSVTDRCSGTDFTSQAQEPSRPARKQRTTPCGVESTWTHRTRKPNTLKERQESKRTYSIRLETVPRNCSKNTQPCHTRSEITHCCQQQQYNIAVPLICSLGSPSTAGARRNPRCLAHTSGPTGGRRLDAGGLGERVRPAGRSSSPC